MNCSECFLSKGWEDSELDSKVFGGCGKVTKRSVDDRNKEREVGIGQTPQKRYFEGASKGVL